VVTLYVDFKYCTQYWQKMQSSEVKHLSVI